jgi:AraC-like DNA-binding protein
LNSEYSLSGTDYPQLQVGTLDEVFGFDSNRYSFQKKCLLYCDSYTYQNGSQIGTICILFDINNLVSDMESSIDEGYGYSILYNGDELFATGEQNEKIYSSESERCPGLVCKVYASDNIAVEGNVIFHVLMVVMIVISLGFVWLAYWESRKYYMPIDNLDQMIKGEGVSRNFNGDGEKEVDKMESIISGIQSLIGEKNGYRERMMTITPYAKTGVLHSMITGNMEKESIQVFSEENYLDLIMPYFIVGVVNLAYLDEKEPNKEKRKQDLKAHFKVIGENFSTEEIHIVYYFKDIYNVFLIVNFENNEPMDDLFYQIHKYLSIAMENEKCKVTMGVDIVREDINALKEACDSAMLALDGILTNGRGEVYFREEQVGKSTVYYFPDNFKEKLKKYLEKDMKEEMCALLADIYQKNWDLDGTPEMYRALIDELHLAVMKTLREITELKTTHINIEKYDGLATLQEVFDYYELALCSIADSFRARQVQAEADFRLEDEIIRYIEENCYDPELSLQSLSEKFNVSCKYLSLLCKKHYGMTYLQYVQNMRIHKAAQLLAVQEHSLSEVATMCGYTNQLTFRRNFKSILGVNPSDYICKN